MISPAGTAPSMIEQEEIGTGAKPMTAGDIVASLTGWRALLDAQADSWKLDAEADGWNLDFGQQTTITTTPGLCDPQFDPITKPEHYCQGDIEPWEFIESQNLGFHEGSAVSYIARARYKGDQIGDLRKAINFLSRKVTLLEKENSGQ